MPFASFDLVAPTKFDSARKLLVESKVSSRKHMLQAGCFRTVTLCLLLAELFSDIVAKKLFSTKSAEVSLRRGLLVCVAVSVLQSNEMSFRLCNLIHMIEFKHLSLIQFSVIRLTKDCHLSAF